MHIIIDGYNLIRQSATFSRLDLEDMQTGREALIDALADYKKIKRHRITVVLTVPVHRTVPLIGSWSKGSRSDIRPGKSRPIPL